jgi:hypothetical protein
VVITVEQIMSWKPCQPDYPEALVRELVGDGKTPLEMLDLPIHPADRLWVVLREEVIPKRELGLLACDYADAALPIWTAVRPDDTRMEEGIAVARRWWRGEATAAEVDSAQEAAGRAARDAWESNSAEGDAAAAVAWAV